MAAVGEDVGVPSVLPDVAAPDNYQRIQADPNAFGGGIAAGLQKAGGALTQAADTGFDTLHFYNQVAADQGVNDYADRANKLLYGDPNKMVVGPDGTKQPDTGYFGLRGDAAMSARQGVSAQLDDLAKEVKGKLSTDDSKLAFDSATRRLRFSFDSDIGRHADQQQTVWAKSVNEATSTIALNSLAARPDDPAVQASALNNVLKSYIQQAHLDGTDPSAAALRAQQDVAMTRIRAVLPTDPLRAQKMLDENKDLIGSLPAYDALYNTVSLRARDVTAHSAADAALATPLPAGTGGHATGAASSDPNFAGQLFVKAPDGVISYTGPRIPTEQQAQSALAAILPGVKFGSAERSPDDNAATHGAAPNSMHLRGHAVDIPIQNLPAGVTEQDAVQRIRDAGFPATEVLGSDYAKAHGEGAHIHIGWEPKTGAGPTPEQTGPDKPATSLADYYRTNFAPIQDQARQLYLAQNPNDTEGADRAASLADTKMRAVLTQDDMRVKADYHALDAAGDKPGPNGQKPITIDQLLQNNPTLRSGWENLQLSNPYAAANFENHLLKSNAMPANATYGNDFYNLYGKVVGGQIKDPTQLLNYIDATKGDASPLTKEGYGELSNMIGAMATPQGSALAGAERDFFNRIRPNVTLTNPQLNMADPEGDKKFNQLMIAALGRIRAEAANGTPPAKIFDPKGDIATMAQNYMMSPLDASKRQISAFRMPANFGGTNANAPDLSTPAGLKAAVAGGLVPKDRAIDIAVRNKWIAPPQQPIPTPH